jgi:hypothetical protein
MSERAAAVRALKRLSAELGTLRILNVLEFGIPTDVRQPTTVALTIQAYDNADDSPRTCCVIWISATEPTLCW